MALTNAAAMPLDPLGFEDEIEPPPPTKRLDRRDLQAVVAIMSHIDEDDAASTRTVIVSPEENARLRAEALADSSEILSSRDEDVDIHDDVTVETKAPFVPLPAWVFDEPLDAAALSLPGGPASQIVTRRSEGVAPTIAAPPRSDARVAGLLAGAWMLAVTALAGAGYVLAFVRP